MRAATAGRGTVALAAVGALLLLALATAPWARASTIYACVKKRGGALHVVSKAAKCNRREPKQSWSKSGPTGAMGVESVNGVSGAGGPSGANGVTGATGPAGDEDGTGSPGDPGAKGSSGATGAAGATGETGASGARGTTGTNGANGTTGTTGAKGEVGATGVTGAGGAVAGYSVRQAATKRAITSETEASPTTVVSRELPAGNYIVNATVELQLSDTKTGGQAGIACHLVDTPSEEGAPAFDPAEWMTAIDVPFSGFFFAGNSMPFTLAVSSAAHSSSIAIVCYMSLKQANGGEFAANASNGLITAVQTTQNS